MPIALTPVDLPALITEKLGKAPGKCRWFAFCQNQAEGTEHHPALGDVPICGRCKDRISRLRQLNRPQESAAAEASTPTVQEGLTQ